MQRNICTVVERNFCFEFFRSARVIPEEITKFLKEKEKCYPGKKIKVNISFTQKEYKFLIEAVAKGPFRDVGDFIQFVIDNIESALEKLESAFSKAIVETFSSLAEKNSDVEDVFKCKIFLSTCKKRKLEPEERKERKKWILVHIEPVAYFRIKHYFGCVLTFLRRYIFLAAKEITGVKN